MSTSDLGPKIYGPHSSDFCAILADILHSGKEITNEACCGFSSTSAEDTSAPYGKHAEPTHIQLTAQNGSNTHQTGYSVIESAAMLFFIILSIIRLPSASISNLHRNGQKSLLTLGMFLLLCKYVRATDCAD